MWKPFQHEDKLYMIKVIQGEELIVYLTDLQNIWIQNISNEALLQEFQKCNPLFDIKVEDVVAEVNNLVGQITESATVDVVENNDEFRLDVESIKEEFSIKFQFNLTKAASEVFLKEVTVPLIQTVKHLEACQNMLCNLIKKKDRELEEYKLEKGEISRADLITEKFEDGMLNTIDDKSMLNVFGQSESFWNAFSQQYGNIEAKIEDVKSDPWNHMKRKRKVYSSKTAIKRGKGINYERSE